MNFNSVKYLFTEGLKNLFKNIFMTIASVGVLTACLLVVGFSMILKKNLNNLIRHVGEEKAFFIFLNDDAKPEQIENLKNSLNSTNNIKSLKYISKDQALKEFNKTFNNDLAMNALNKKNVLPASLELNMKDISILDEIYKIVEDTKFSSVISSIKSPSKHAKIIKDIDKTSKIIGTAMIIFFVIASLAIISNTIRAAVFARRREIAIMKQVGATDSFVRFPFLIEGAAIGVIASFLAFFLTVLIYETLYTMLTKNPSAVLRTLFLTMVQFKRISFLIGLGYITFGTLAGSLGSLISVRKYLKI